MRVACIGDSITVGAGTRDPVHDGYPGWLQEMLGLGWEVRNFAVNGTTMLKQGDKPYWNQQAFHDAQAFLPDAVVIMLGTNDTKPQNWDPHGTDYVSDYSAMIGVFRSLPSRPRIWIARPVPAFKDNYGITENIIRNGILPGVDQVAAKTGASVIDLHAALLGRGDLFPDGIHPNAEGQRHITATVFDVSGGRPSSSR